MKAFEEIKAIIDGAEQDVVKFEKGQKSVRSRIRKYLQQISVICKTARKDIMLASKETPA